MTDTPNARLLDCGYCYEEQGEEVHPHPECPIGRPAPARYRDRRDGDVVEAVQWTGSNAAALAAFAPDRFATAAPEDRIDPEDDALVLIEESHWVAIRPGCWVLKYPDHFDVESDANFRAAYEAVVSAAAPSTDQAALRSAFGEVLRRWGLLDEQIDQKAAEEFAVTDLLALLPAPAERPLSPYYEHPECGFHWHGSDGMDIPMRDGQPVCPRCELAKTEKKLAALQRRRDEVGAECKRRGKRVLEQSEQIVALERQLDEVQRQLGAEILRAGQAEAELRRLAAEAPSTNTQADELTAEEARELADDLGLQLYRAQDALAFAEECCVIADREQRPVTTADVREWLKGARCGRQLVADGRAPELPPLDQDPVARRLGLLPAPATNTQADEAPSPDIDPVYDPRAWETYRRDAGCGCTAPAPVDCKVPHGTGAWLCVCHRLSGPLPANDPGKPLALLGGSISKHFLEPNRCLSTDGIFRCSRPTGHAGGHRTGRTFWGRRPEDDQRTEPAVVEPAEAADTDTQDGAQQAAPDCEHCDGTGLDPDAYTVSGDKGAEVWTHIPCTECLPEDDQTPETRRG